MRLLLLCLCLLGPAYAAPGNPLASATAEAVTRAGIVAEALRAGTYTYLRIASGADSTFWIATMGEGVPAGRAVVATSYARATNFSSRRLSRRFAVLHFGTIIPQETR